MRICLALLSMLALDACAGPPPAGSQASAAAQCPNETGSHISGRTCSGSQVTGPTSPSLNGQAINPAGGK